MQSFGRYLSSLKQFPMRYLKFRELVTLRLVPGRGTSNKTNYRFFHTLHELGDLREPIKKRIVFKPFSILDREFLWWDVVLTADTARFYVTVPAEWENWVLSKVQRIWEGVVVSHADIEDLELLKIDGITCKLSLKRHNMFSLAVDRREETHPIGEVLGVLDDLQDKEKVRVVVRLDPISRVRWHKAAESAHKRFGKGKLPKRGVGGPKQLIMGILHINFWLLGQVMEAFASFLPGGGKYRSPLSLQKDDIDRGEIMVDGKLSRSTSEKANLPAFSCSSFVVVESRDTVRSEGLLASVIGALSSEMDENNEWVKVKQKPGVIQFINQRQVTMGLDKVVLSTKELGKLCQLPTAGVQDLYRKQVMASEKLSVDLSPELTGAGIPYGVAECRGKNVPVSFPLSRPDEVVKVNVFIGDSGSGKTTAIQNRVLGALAAGKSVFCYEFAKREFLDEIMSALPADFPEEKIVCLDHGNKQWPICPTWTECGYGIEDAGDVIAGEFWTFFSQGGGAELARTQMWLKHAALSCADAGCLDPLNVVLMLLSKSFRGEVLQNVSDPLLKGMWAQWDKASEANQIAMAAPIISRLNHVLGHRHLKYSLCQKSKLGKDGKPLIDMRKWADGGYLVLHYIPKSAFGAAALDTFMGWYNAKEWLMTLARPLNAPECLVFKDEVHQIPSLSLKAEEQIVEGRKYRVGQNWAFHSWAQIEKMSPSLFKILKANNPNICLLKSDEDTYRMLAKMMQPFDLEKDLLKMDNWSAVNKWRVGGKDLTFMCKLNGPVRKVKDRGYLWERHSKLYGRAKDEVAADVVRREMALFEVTERKKRK